VIDYLADPAMFERSEMQAIEQVAWGVRRKRGSGGGVHES